MNGCHLHFHSAFGVVVKVCYVTAGCMGRKNAGTV